MEKNKPRHGRASAFAGLCLGSEDTRQAPYSCPSFHHPPLEGHTSWRSRCFPFPRVQRSRESLAGPQPLRSRGDTPPGPRAWRHPALRRGHRASPAPAPRQPCAPPLRLASGRGADTSAPAVPAPGAAGAPSPAGSGLSGQPVPPPKVPAARPHLSPTPRSPRACAAADETAAPGRAEQDPAGAGPALTERDDAPAHAGLGLDLGQEVSHAVLLVKELVEPLPHGCRHGGGRRAPLGAAPGAGGCRAG